MKAERTCRTCCEVKPAGAFSAPAARKCDDCKTNPRIVNSRCSRCGESKPRSDFARHSRVCPVCREQPMPSVAARRLRACNRCGVVKDADEFAWGDGSRGRGRSQRRKGTCRTCEALARASTERVMPRSSWEQDGVIMRRCSKCGHAGPLEADFYVTKPRAIGMQRWRYWCKQCDSQRSAEYKRKMVADPEWRARYAAWKREWAKRNPERYKAGQQRYKDKVKADPQRHAAALETARIAYRLREERKNGRHVDDIRKQRAHFPLPSDRFGRLPALPIVRAVESYAQREAMDEKHVCERVGVDPRNLFAWRTGERQLVHFDVADRVLTGLGLSWWDVWDVTDPAIRVVWERKEAA